MTVRNGSMALAALALLSACAAKPPPPAPPGPPELPPHMGTVPTKACTVPPYQLALDSTASVAMRLGNDGGYCAIRLLTKAGKPFDAGLEPVQPTHGSAVIVKYSGHTSIEYVPKPGYVGTDAFVVKLIERTVPGYTTLKVTVTVVASASQV